MMTLPTDVTMNFYSGETENDVIAWLVLLSVVQTDVSNFHQMLQYDIRRSLC